MQVSPAMIPTVTGVRSSPPPITTSVANEAAIPIAETAKVMLSRFCHCRKYSDENAEVDAQGAA